METRGRRSALQNPQGNVHSHQSVRTFLLLDVQVELIGYSHPKAVENVPIR